MMVAEQRGRMTVNKRHVHLEAHAELRPIVTDVAWSLCLSVCLLVTETRMLLCGSNRFPNHSFRFCVHVPPCASMNESSSVIRTACGHRGWMTVEQPHKRLEVQTADVDAQPVTQRRGRTGRRGRRPAETGLVEGPVTG